MRHALLASLIIPLSSLVLVVGPVGAADDAELERIRSAVAEAITQPIGGLDGPKIELASPVTAAWRDGKVIVSLKGAKVQTPIEASIAVGDVEIAVLPRGDGLYDFDVAMPKTIPIQGHSPKERATLSFAAYKFSGTWAHEVDSIINLDVMFDDMLLTNETNDPKEKFNVSIGDVGAKTNYTKDSSGLWDGAASAKLGPLVINAPAGEGDLEMAAMEATATTKGSDWTNAAKAMAQLKEVMKPGAPPLTDEQRHALATMFGNINWGSNEATLNVRGLGFIQEGKRLFSLGNTTWKVLFDAAQEAGTLGMRIAVDDLKIEEQFLPANLTPTKGAIDVTMEQFPVRAFLASIFMQATESGQYAPPSAPPAEPPMPAPSEPAAANPETPTDPNRLAEGDANAGAEPAPSASDMIGENSAAASEPPPAEAPMASEPPMMGPFRADDPFLQRIFELGSQVVINEFSVNASGAGISANGRVKVDQESETMGTGKLQAKLRGIDTALEYVNAQAKADPDMKAFGAFLIFLKGLGRAESSGGETIYVYDIDVPKQGAPTVNGTSLENMDFD